MNRVLIISRNLIGDALSAGIAIREWFRLHDPFHMGKASGVDEVDLLTTQDHVTALYYGLGVEWAKVFTSEAKINEHYDNLDLTKIYGKVYALGAGDAGKYSDDHQCHIVEGFCHQLEIDPPQVSIIDTPYGKYKAYKPYYDPWATLSQKEEEWNKKIVANNFTENLILFSPFSASCASRKGEPPNKMLPKEHWARILEFLRTLGPIRMLGAPDDSPEPEWKITEEEVMTGVPLDWLAACMKKAKLIVTVDNGMSHLAASQDAKHILFYPMCLSLGFILPWGANNTVPIQIEPTQVSITQLMMGIKRATKHLRII